MKRTSIFFTAGLMFLTTLSFTSCQKDDDTDPIVSYATADADADSYYDDVLAEVDELTMISDASKDSYYTTLSLTGEGTRTRKTSWEGNVRIDTIIYGNYVNPNSRYERVKNGTLIIHTTGNYKDPEFVREVTFNNFTIDGNQVEGTKRITKTAEYTYSITLQNGKITFTDGTTYTRETTRTRTWLSGYDTPLNIWDDVYTFEGSATGVNRNGYTYTHRITNALMIKMTCRWAVEGTIELTVGNESGTLDYGSGECDNVATVTRNGKSYEVRLKGGN